MDATPRRSRFGRLPAGLVGMLGLVVAVEGIIARHDLDFLNVDNWQCRLYRSYAKNKARDCDVLCFGDSLVKLSIVPTIVEARSGLKGYNLAICGSQAPMSYALLKRAVAGGARPRAVLVDFWPPLMRRGPRHNLQQWPHLLSFAECVELGLASRDGSLFGSIVAGRALPSARDRHKVRAYVVAMLAGKPSLWRGENPWLIRHWNRHRGGQVMRAIPEPPQGTEPEKWREGFYPDWRCNKVNRIYIEKFLALAAEHHIPVYWMLTPILEGVQDAIDRSGFDAAHMAFIRGWQARFSNVSVIDARHTNYDPAVFMDPNHLGREGAYVFSTELGDLLRRLVHDPSRPRWVSIPRYRPRPVDESFEDVVTSRTAFYDEFARRK